MRPVPQLIARLKNTPELTSIVGQRIYADNPPQDDDLPFVILTILSGTAFGTISNCQVKAYSARLNVDVITDSRGTSEEAIEVIEDTIDGYASTDETHPIQGVTVDGAIEWQVLTPVDGSDQRGYWCAQDFQIHYRRNKG